MPHTDTPRTDTTFAGSIPYTYDRYLVPLIFEAYAEDMARRVASLTPAAMLETAAGTGAVARTLAPRLAEKAPTWPRILARP